MITLSHLWASCASDRQVLVATGRDAVDVEPGFEDFASARSTALFRTA
jgi:hypothetical protein